MFSLLMAAQLLIRSVTWEIYRRLQIGGGMSCTFYSHAPHDCAFIRRLHLQLQFINMKYAVAL